MADEGKVTTPAEPNDAHERLREVAADLGGADNEVALESLSQWQLAWRRFKRHKMAMVGLMYATGLKAVPVPIQAEDANERIRRYLEGLKVENPKVETSRLF